MEGQKSKRRDSKKEREPIQILINMRPYIREVLKRLSENFILGIFTAAEKSYADEVLKVIDPKDNLFSIKLYREHCTNLTQSDKHHLQFQGEKIKDLRILH